jgi:phage terminase large subunit-like protein
VCSATRTRTKLVGQTWEPGDCPACRRIDAGDDGARTLPFNVYEVVYDPYQLAGMMQALRRDGVVYCKEMVQSGPRLTADRKLLEMIVGGRLAHCGDARLREHVQNSKAKTQKDEESKLRIVKKAVHRRIDLCVAASMAVSEVMRLNL